MFFEGLTNCSTCGVDYVTGDCITNECEHCEKDRMNNSVSALFPFCTLTGVDENTDINKLWALAKKYPFVEFGVLISKTRAGSADKRYPSLDFIKELGNKMNRYSSPNFALHICGTDTVLDFMDETSDVYKLSRPFNRIQLNFISKKYPIDSIRRLFVREKNKFIITQYNNANKELWRKLSDFNNHHVLFDASGGRGKEISDFIPPLDIESEGLPFQSINPLCGYAGGIGPDNVSDVLEKISSIAPYPKYWIDMEQKLRDSADIFDLNICEDVLEKVDIYLKSL